MRWKYNHVLIRKSFFLLYFSDSIWLIMGCVDDSDVNADEFEIQTWAKPKLTMGEPFTPPNNQKKIPTRNQILANNAIKMQMEYAWNCTESFASANGWREIGFYIYYDKEIDSLYCGEMKYGNIVTSCNDTTISVDLGIPIDKNKVCAFFHTHPTLQYCKGSGLRYCGPSNADERFASANKYPGFVYDYDVEIVRCGHKPNGEKYLYEYGPNRRPN